MRFVLHVFPLPVDVVGGNKGWMGTFCPPEMEGVMMSGDLEHRGRSKLTIKYSVITSDGWSRNTHCFFYVQS